jgi:hypothetical protein
VSAFSFKPSGWESLGVYHPNKPSIFLENPPNFFRNDFRSQARKLRTVHIDGLPQNTTLQAVPMRNPVLGSFWLNGGYYSHLPGLVNVYITMEHHHFFMGKSTISMAIFNSFLYVYQAG